MKPSRQSAFAVALVAVVLTSVTALAASVNWTGGDFTWSSPDNDSFSAQYNNGDTVTFNDTGAGTVTVSGSLSPASVTFLNTTGNDYTFQSGNLRYGGDISLSGSGNVTFSSTGMLPWTGRIDLGSGTTLTYSNNEIIGSLTGSGSWVGTSGNNALRLGADNSDFAFSGSMTIPGGGSNTFGKIGTGTFTYAGTTNLTTRDFKVFDGKAVVQAMQVNGQAHPGGIIEADKTINNTGADRFDNAVKGGEFILRGNASAASFSDNSQLSLGAPYGNSTITLIPGPGQTAYLEKTWNYGVMSINNGSAILIRGTDLGGQTRVRVKSEGGPTAYDFFRDFLVGGTLHTDNYPLYTNYGTPEAPVLRHVLGDTDVNGNGVGLCTYVSNKTTVLAGNNDVGIRLLTDAEYSGTIASGEAFADPTQMQNKRLNSAVTGIDASTRVTSLTLQTGGSVSGIGTLVVESGDILSTGTNGAITVTNLQPGVTALTTQKGWSGEQVTLTTPEGDDYMSISSNISGTDQGLVKAGYGTVALTGTNSYTGATIINRGALRATDGTGIPANSNITFGGGVLESSGTFNRTIGNGTSSVRWVNNFSDWGNSGDFTAGGFSANGGALAVQLNGGTSTLTWGATNFVPTNRPLMFGSYTAGAVVDFQNGLDLGAWEVFATGTRTIEVTDNPNSTADRARISGAITGADASVGLVKTGDGTLELNSRANTYAGQTTVAAGTLLVTGSLSASSSLVSVLDGAALGGTGSIRRPITADSGATLSPGTCAGTLTTGSLTLNPDTILDFELGPNGIVGGGVNDLIAVQGDLVLDGILNITDIGGFAPTNTYRLFTFTGDFIDNGLVAGTIPGKAVTIITGEGFVDISVVPEPCMLALLGVGGLGLLLRRRQGRGTQALESC